ncbi:hypothetical protein IW262DRAFT_1291013 [Armillaria fumosa]|nr:hypothetical protein IW262DRAFT_1291013 [Armillaria fumosa]
MFLYLFYPPFFQTVHLQASPLLAHTVVFNESNELLTFVAALHFSRSVRDPVPGSFIPYSPVSQALTTDMEANPMFLVDLEAVVLIWRREDTEGKLEKVSMEMIETRSVYGKLNEITIGQLNPFEELSVDTKHRLAALKRS